jgi:hypothetical protein
LLSVPRRDKIAASLASVEIRVRAEKSGKKRKGPTMPTSRQEKAITALLATDTLGQAAQQVGVTERTLRNWLRDPSFLAAYRQARSQILEHSLGVMQGAAISAVTCLQRNLSCGRHSVEVAAAGKILEHSLGAVELFDLAQRVAELEERLEGGTHAYSNAFPNGQAHGGASR